MKTFSRVGLVLTLLTGVTAGLNAQSLKPGTWTGQGVDPGGGEFELTFDVQTVGDSLTITMVSPEGEKFELSQIRFEGKNLHFRWEPGIVVNCVLSPVDGGGYSGPCIDESGGSGVLSMTPPK